MPPVAPDRRRSRRACGGLGQRRRPPPASRARRLAPGPDRCAGGRRTRHCPAPADAETAADSDAAGQPADRGWAPRPRARCRSGSGPRPAPPQSQRPPGLRSPRRWSTCRHHWARAPRAPHRPPPRTRCPAHGRPQRLRHEGQASAPQPVNRRAPSPTTTTAATAISRIDNATAASGSLSRTR